MKSADFPQSLTLQHLRDPLSLCQRSLKRVEVRLANLNIVHGYVTGPVLDKETTKCLKNLDDLMSILRLALDADNLANVREIDRELKSLHLTGVEQMQIVQDDNQADHEATAEWKREID
ncbi:hypothetical protein ACLMJK_000760 [Lecanora helva]